MCTPLWLLSQLAIDEENKIVTTTHISCCSSPHCPDARTVHNEPCMCVTLDEHNGVAKLQSIIDLALQERARTCMASFTDGVPSHVTGDHVIKDNVCSRPICNGIRTVNTQVSGPMLIVDITNAEDSFLRSPGVPRSVTCPGKCIPTCSCGGVYPPSYRRNNWTLHFSLFAT